MKAPSIEGVLSREVSFFGMSDFRGREKKERQRRDRAEGIALVMIRSDSNAVEVTMVEGKESGLNNFLWHISLLLSETNDSLFEWP